MADEKEKKSTAKKTVAKNTSARIEAKSEEEKAKLAEALVEKIGSTSKEEESNDDGQDKKDEEQVLVSKSDLAAITARLDSLQADNEKLMKVADKGRLAAVHEEERAGVKTLPRVKLTRMGGPTGKLVIAWKITKNESYVDGNRLVEKQEIELFYEDGTSERTPLITFYRQQNKDTVAEILSRTKSEDGEQEMLKVRLLSDGTEVDIDLKFVN